MVGTRSKFFFYFIFCLSLLGNLFLVFCIWETKQPFFSADLPSKSCQNPLILSIGCFDYSKSQKENLPGSEAVIDRLNASLREKGYRVESTYPKGSLKRKDVDAFLRKWTKHIKENPGVYDGVFVFYTGHGEENSLLLSDGKHYNINKLFGYFENSTDGLPEMVDFPKVFFLDKCRGPIVQDEISKKKHPRTNFLILFSTHLGEQTKDNPAGPNGEQVFLGSYAGRHFIDYLEQNEAAFLGKKLSIQEIFQLVNGHVNNASEGVELTVMEDAGSGDVYFKRPHRASGSEKKSPPNS